MKMLLPVLAKRLLSFTLALVLLLSLCPALPLTADAANYQERWQYSGSYSWLTDIYFASENATNVDGIPVFENDKPYDWKITVYQARTTVSITAKVTIIDENGDIVGSSEVTGSSKEATKGETSVMFSASEYHSALSTDLAGTFTLTCKLYYGASLCGTLTQTFRRIIEDKNASFDATSRSNPDMVFTYADPIDLVLHIEKTDGVEESFYAATTITNTNGEPIAENIYFIPSSTNIDVSVKDMVPVTNIKTPGNYSVNVALYSDISAPARYTTTIPFAVVAMDRTVTVSITGSNSFAGTVPNLTVNAHKDDGVTEYCTALVTVTDTDTGSTVYSNTFEGDISGTSANPTKLYPNLDNLPIVGNFRMDVVVKDSDGIERGTDSHTFTRTQTPITATMTGDIPNPEGEHPTGMIYTDADTPLGQLTIVHPSSANETLTIQYTGKYNGEALNETRTITMPDSGSVTLNAKDYLKYGIYEDLTFKVFDSNGTCSEELGPYTFSLVRTAAAPGSLSMLNINDHFTTGNGNNPNKITLISNAGANMWRASIPWASIEKSENEQTGIKYNYKRFKMLGSVKEAMDATKSSDMQALLLLAYGNDEMYGEPNPTSDEWLTAYGDYCYYVADMMAQYYPDQVIGFEIWNEWNHKTMSKVPQEYQTGAHYAEVVKVASARIRQVNEERNTSFKVIAGATAGDAYLEEGETTSNSYQFIPAMLNVSGFVAAVDGISFHTYSSTEKEGSLMDKIQGIRRFEYISPTEHDYVARIHNFKEILEQYGAGSKEIWLTETGWTTNSVPEDTNRTSDGKRHITTGVTEQEQAAYLVQLYTWAIADGTLSHIFWYDFMNDISNDTKVWANNLTESNYGLIHNAYNTGDQPLEYSAKQSYVAMCAMSSMLSGATNGQSIGSLFGTGVHAYQFEKDGHILVVAWTDNDADTTRTVTFGGNMIITDMFGNATTYSGTATLELSECPIYLEYAKGSHPSIG